MLFLISPAKTLDFETRTPAVVQRRATQPAYTAQAAALIEVLRRQSVADVAALMDLSDALATLNVARFANWSPQATLANAKPAVLAFNGDVYEGLDARSMNTADLDWAQAHVRILSGLYGVLRPLDLLQPYRLEMGTALTTPAGRDLYAYWGDTVAEHLNADLAEERSPLVVNLASQEYARVALRRALKPRVVECVFEDWKSGQWKVISFFAKRARGLMLRHATDHRARSVQALKSFDAEGYAFDADASERDRLVFRRRGESPSG